MRCKAKPIAKSSYHLKVFDRTYYKHECKNGHKFNTPNKIEKKCIHDSNNFYTDEEMKKLKIYKYEK